MRRQYPTSFREKRLNALYTDLVRAACANDPVRVDAVLDRGARINRANERGETAFSFACTYDCWHAARRLHARGADINTVDVGGGSPLDWAVCHASPAFLNWLVAVGARRNDPSPIDN